MPGQQIFSAISAQSKWTTSNAGACDRQAPVVVALFRVADVERLRRVREFDPVLLEFLKDLQVDRLLAREASQPSCLDACFLDTAGKVADDQEVADCKRLVEDNGQ